MIYSNVPDAQQIMRYIKWLAIVKRLHTQTYINIYIYIFVVTTLISGGVSYPYLSAKQYMLSLHSLFDPCCYSPGHWLKIINDH